MTIGLEARIPVTNRAYNRKVGDYVRMPVTDGLLGQWFIGGSADFSARNRWAKGGYGHGEVYGSPVFSDFYGSFKSGSSGIILPFSDTPEMSYLAVVRNTDTMVSSATRPMFIGTSPGGSAGASLWCFNTTQARMSVYYSGSTVAANNSINDLGINAWRLLIASFSASEVALYDMTANDGSTAAAAGIRNLASMPISIGANPGATSVTGTFDAAYVGIINRAIDVVERESISDWATEYFAPLGIAV